MREVQSVVRNWGNSLGVTFPNEVVKELHVKSGEKIKLLILKESNVLKETFGTLKLKKSVKALMKESDRDLYD